VSADQLATKLLEEAGVALLAGSAFGQTGRDNLRISYANSQPNLDRALNRITTLIDNLAS
jgi:aspartate/methionine/tyrosine aminotransferase